MDIKKHIPNSISLLNVFCGSIATVFAAHGNFIMAAIFVFLGIFFDFFDGLLARKLNVYSELGVQLDSLADIITSGVVPGIIMFKLLSMTVNETDAFFNEWNSLVSFQGLKVSFLPFLGFLITVSSAYRLGKFNLDEEQKTHFIGLPTPANTLLIVSLPLIMEFQNNDLMNNIIMNKWFLITLTFASSFMLNAKVKLFALKFNDWSFKNNAVRYVFLVLCLVSLIVLEFAAIPFMIVLYVIMSMLNNLASKTNHS